MSNLIISTVVKEDQDNFDEKGIDCVAQANTTTILTAGQYSGAISLMKLYVAFQKAVKEVWDPVCDSMNKAHKTATAGRKGQLEPFIEAEKTIKKKMDVYDLEQERLRKVEQAKLDKIAEDERQRIQDEQDEKLAEALKMEAKGDTEGASELLEDAADLQEQLEVPAQVAEKSTPKGGVTFINNWKFVVDDPHLIPREYCIPDQSKLNASAKATEGTAKIAGGHFVNDRTIRRA